MLNKNPINVKIDMIKYILNTVCKQEYVTKDHIISYTTSQLSDLQQILEEVLKQ